ncbi:OmpH family outer membrane protein [uncultured Roseobacter sp.]|uniref:OmpH family outer membrane protein n=1 Tax=uncultured Roseobacter sp. TaxID=114847 RepID=UPI002614D25D|nr:OmpH family outer membrane protein [uncultured Roseobacter sp.]
MAALVRSLFGATLLAFALAAGAVSAQERSRITVKSPVLTIDSERVFEASNFGRATAQEFEALGAGLSAENRRIEEELSQEEREITEMRAGLSPQEFRELADAFDEKVQNIRREQDAKTRQLNADLEERRRLFLNAAAPVLEQLMREAGAGVIMEQRTVFISSNAIDITDVAISRLNEVLPEPGSAPEQ